MARLAFLSPPSTGLRASNVNYLGAARCRRKFELYYPGGFHDEVFLVAERSNKERAHLEWQQQLGPVAMRKLLARGEYRDIADIALRIESRYFVELATGPVSRAMIQAFFVDLPSLTRSRGEAESTVTKVAVLGAGMMGSGIAYECARRGALDGDRVDAFVEEGDGLGEQGAEDPAGVEAAAVADDDRHLPEASDEGHARRERLRRGPLTADHLDEAHPLNR